MFRKYTGFLTWCAAALICGWIAQGSAWALPGDIDDSGRVDGFDLIVFSHAYNSTEADAHWNPVADLNNDGTVDDSDFAILRDYFGKRGVGQNCWVADEYNSRIVKLSGGTGQELVRAGAGEISYPKAVWADPSDSSCWVASSNSRVMHYSADGELQVTVSGFNAPQGITVDPLRNTVWVADKNGNRIVKLSSGVPDGYDIGSDTGSHTIITGLSGPSDVSVNTTDGSCWVADTNNNRIVKILPGLPSSGYDLGSETGYHAAFTGFNRPLSVSVDHITGECWVADTNNNQVVKLSSDGLPEEYAGGFKAPNSVSVDPTTGNCWVSDKNNGEVVKLSPTGAELVRVSGFYNPSSVSADVVRGNCWVADRDNNQVVKLAVNGAELLRISGFSRPSCVAAVPPEKGQEPPTARVQVSATQVDPEVVVGFDGSASTDYLHDIILYEWDFEGDGVFDYRSEDPLAAHSYDQVGAYVAALRVTNDIWLSDIAHTPPIRVGRVTAVASADPLTVEAEQSVTFTFDAIDPIDGRVEKFLWDFDGDGSDDAEFTAPSQHQRTYPKEGTYKARLRVLDEGNVTSDPVYITITVTNAAPTAQTYPSTTQGAGELQVDFNGTGTDKDGSVIFYEWDFDGDGVYDWFNHSTGKASYLYTKPGTYTATLRVTDDDENEATASADITVTHLPPDAGISADPGTGNAPLQVTFDGSASSAPEGSTITEYAWDFGDGETASGTDSGVTHTYTEPGGYTAVLTVTTDHGLTDDASLKIKAFPQGTPTAKAGADPDSGLVPLEVTFSSEGSADPDGSIVKYEWDFDGAFEDDVESGAGVWTPDEPWAITDKYAHSGVSCWTDSPEGDYAANSDTSLTGGPFDFTASETIVLSFWHRYVFNWYAYGRVEVSTDGGDAWNEVTSFGRGTQDQWTRAQVDLSDYAGNPDVRIRFRLTSSYSYLADGWYIDDIRLEGVMGEVDSEETSPTHTYDQSGTYHPMLMVTDDGGLTATGSVEVIARSKPEAMIEKPEAGGSYFKQDVVFSGGATDPDGVVVLYEWDFDGDDTYDWSSTAQGNVLHSFSSAGTYTASLRVTDNDGLTDTASVTFDIIDQGPVDISATSDVSKGNAPVVVSFDGSAVDEDGSVVKYEWDFDGDGTYDWGSAGPGQVVSFSTQYNTSSWAASNLIDGLVATSESRGWRSASNAEFPHEIIFSLGQGRTWDIDRVAIDPQTTDSNTYWAKDFELLVSTTGVEEGDFEPVESGVTYTLAQMAGFQEFSFAPKSAKYVKLVITSNYGGYYTQLGEVAVYSGHLNVISPLTAAVEHTYDTPGTHSAVLQATDNEGLTSTASTDVTVFESDFLGATGILSVTSGYSPLEVDFTGFGFSGYEVLDDFEDGTIDALWGAPVGGGSWAEEDGVFKQTSNDGNDADDPDKDFYGVYLVAGDGTWDDYSFSVDMRSSDDDTMGVLFRYQSDTEYYLFEWNRQGRTGISPRRLLKRTSAGVEELAADDVVYETNRWYRVRIDVAGGRFAVYVDDEMVFQGRDSDYTSGGAGLWCNWNANTWFDNAYLAGDAPSLYEWDFGDGSSPFSSTTTGHTTHTYNTPGTYTATLTVTDAGGTRTDTYSKTLRILPKGVGFGKAWVADRYNDRLVLLAADGETVIKQVGGFGDPQYMAFDTARDVLWVADLYSPHKVYRIDGDVPDGYSVSGTSGYHKVYSGFYYPNDLDVDEGSGACWVADRANDRVVRIPGTLPDMYNTSSNGAPDLTANENTGWLEGNAQFAAGKIDNGILFDGYRDYVQIPDDPDSFRVGSWTMEAWIKPANFGSSGQIRTIFGKVSQGKDFALVLNGDKIAVLVNDGGRQYVASSDPAAADTWYHVAGVYDQDAGKVRLYVDGALEAEGDYSSDTSNTDPFRVGSSYCCGEWFNGVIDEVRLWNVARSEADIAGGKDSELAGNEAGLVGYWPCNGTAETPEGLVRILGFSNPVDLAVDSSDGVLWVADDGRDKVYRFESGVTDGVAVDSDPESYIEVSGFYNPAFVELDESDGSCWVADQSNHQVVKLSADGSGELLRAGGFDDPNRLAVNQKDGSVWVNDRDRDQVVHLSSDGSLELARVGGFVDAWGLSVDSQTGECWVSDIGYQREDVKRLSPNGTQLSRKGGFNDPYDLVVLSGADAEENQDPPSASGSGDKSSGTAPVEVNFTGDASDNGSIFLYEWDFEGDGVFDYQSADSAAASHTYTDRGYYQPVLRVTDNEGLVDYVLLDPIRVGPVSAGISASPQQGPAPLRVNFTGTAFDPAGSVTGYAWDFNADGTFDATGTAPTYTYQTQGTYPVVLRVTGPSGVFHTMTTVEVSPVSPTASASVSKESGPPPLSVHLQGQGSDPDGSIVIFQWDYDGDGIYDWSSRTEGNTYFTYQQAGEYTPTFRVIDNDGNRTTVSKSIVVNTPPQAAAAADPLEGNASLEVTFDASGSIESDAGDSIGSYQWSFGDGGSDAGAQVTHTYTSAGTFQPKVTVTDSYGATAEASVTVTVKPTGTPEAVAQADPATGDAPLAVAFTGSGSSDDDGTITGYDWDFGEGYRLNENGYPTRQLFLGTWPSTGCGDLSSMQEGILDHEPNEGNTFGGKTWFAAQDADGNFNWDGVFGGHSNSYAYSHIYLYSPVEQDVRIKFGADDAARFWVNGEFAYEKDDCEPVYIDKYSFDVTLNQGWNRILASVSEGGGGGWGLAYRITDTGDNPLRLEYSLNKLEAAPAFFSDSADPTHTYQDPGTYEARLTVTDDEGKTDTASVEITVTVPGAPVAEASADPVAGDNPLRVEFTGTGSDPDGSIVKYEWDFNGDGVFDWSSETTGETHHIYQDVGTYQAVFRVTDDNGYTGTDEVTITAGLAPEARPYAFPTRGRAPLEVKFTSSGHDEDGTIIWYRWDLNGDGEVESLGDLNGDGWPDNPSEIATAFPYTYTEPGTYDATLTVEDNEGLTHSATIRIVVEAPQLPEAVADADPVFGNPPLEVSFSGYGTDLDGTITKYEWDFGDETTATGQFVTHTYSEPEVYRAVLSVTDSDGNIGQDSIYIRVREAGFPQASAGADPVSEESSFTVHFTGTGSDPDGSIAKYEWDFDGDGTVDYSSKVSGDVVHNYTQVGEYEAVLKVTDDEGNVDVDYVTVQAGFGIRAARDTEIFDPTMGQTGVIDFSLTSGASLTLRILDRQFNVVRTLFENEPYEPGAHSAAWDGKDDGGAVVGSGIYYFVMDYQTEGRSGSLDLTGDVSLARRTPGKDYPSSFSTLEDRPLFVKYSLDKPSETTIYVAEWAGGAMVEDRVKTVLLREPLPSGDYVTTWDGTDDQGRIPEMGVYVWTVFGYDLPDNAIIVNSKPVIEDVSKEPDFYMPADNPYTEDPGKPLAVSFRLSKPATVEAFIKNENDVTVLTLAPQEFQAGVNQLTWDGRNASGALVHPGVFRMGIKATDAFGNESTTEYAVFRVFY